MVIRASQADGFETALWSTGGSHESVLCGCALCSTAWLCATAAAWTYAISTRAASSPPMLAVERFRRGVVQEVASPWFAATGGWATSSFCVVCACSLTPRPTVRMSPRDMAGCRVCACVCSTRRGGYATQRGANAALVTGGGGWRSLLFKTPRGCTRAVGECVELNG